jgi:signal transduction histidine kinase/ActR/RegA family two-component response regulator
MEATAKAAALAVAAIGAAVLVGWALNIPQLKSLSPNLATMKMNTAATLFLCGVALWLKMRPPARRLTHQVGETLAAFAAIIAVLTLTQYIFNIDLHIDEALGLQPVSLLSAYPGRMSVATGVCVFSIATAILLLDHMRRTSQALTLFTLAMAVLVLTSYAYGVRELYRVKIFSSMALHTAAGLALLCVGQLTARPRRCVHRLLTSDSIGGHMTRGMLPAVVIVPLLVGWVRLKGQQAGLYGTEFGLALLVLSTIIILVAVVWYNATLLDRSEAERLRLETVRDDLLTREQSARQRAENAILARDQFLAVVSHELRTPLTPIMLLATALSKNRGLPTDVIDDLQTICDQIQIESKLIGDLLDIVSLGQGAVTLRPLWIDVNQVARSTVNTFLPRFAHKQVRLSGDYQASRSHICADPVRFAQVLGYLLDNALKFTPAEGQVSLRTFDDADRCIGIELIDDGVGIRAEAMDRLFGAFEPGDLSMTRAYGGLGLGLKIARALVELHGGSLSAASEGTNRGAKFTVRLPGATNGTAASQPGEPCGNGSPRRILLVEDNVQTLRAMERLLRTRGHLVKAVTSAGEALAAAQGKPFDLLICDIGLPDSTGWDLLGTLKEQGPIIGIAVSGFATDEDRDRSLKAGFAAHLVKPIDMSQLEQAISQTLISEQALVPSSGTQAEL